MGHHPVWKVEITRPEKVSLSGVSLQSYRFKPRDWAIVNAAKNIVCFVKKPLNLCPHSTFFRPWFIWQYIVNYLDWYNTTWLLYLNMSNSCSPPFQQYFNMYLPDMLGPRFYRTHFVFCIFMYMHSLLCISVTYCATVYNLWCQIFCAIFFFMINNLRYIFYGVRIILGIGRFINIIRTPLKQSGVCDKSSDTVSCVSLSFRTHPCVVAILYRLLSLAVPLSRIIPDYVQCFMRSIHAM